MANVQNSDIWIVDTAASTMVDSRNVKVKSVRWVGATTAGHAAEIQGVDNRVLWSSVAAGANNVESELVERWWMGGFKVPTLASGKLYISFV